MAMIPLLNNPSMYQDDGEAVLIKTKPPIWDISTEQWSILIIIATIFVLLAVAEAVNNDAN